MYGHHLWQPQAVRSHPIPFVQHNLATLTPSPYVQQTWGSSPAQNPTPAPSVIPPRTWVSSPGYSPTPSPPHAPPQTQVSATEHTSTQPPATEHTSTQPPPAVAPQHMSNHSPSVTNQQQPDQVVNMDNGAPIIGDVLTDYGTHYARVIWSDPEHKKLLTIHRRDRTTTKLRHYFNDAPDGSAWKTLVEHSGLTSLLRCQIQCVDHLLVSSFVEHWYPETNTFHLPFGEMTITLHDVFYLTGLKVDGELLRDSGGSEKKLQLDIHRAWGLSKEDINSWFSKSGLLTKKLMEQLQELIANNQNPTTIASLWIFIFIGVTLFLDKSSDRIKPKYARVVLEYIEELDTIAWGTCALALLYRPLGEASRVETKQMSGFGALLHMWIWPYFPSMRTSVKLNVEDDGGNVLPFGFAPDIDRTKVKKDLSRLVIYRKWFDTLKVDNVCCWPYKRPVRALEGPESVSFYRGLIGNMGMYEPYYPDRVVRQFGRVQHIPLPPFKPYEVDRPNNPHAYIAAYGDQYDLWDDRDRHECQFITDMCPLSLAPWEVSDDYFDYHIRHGKPFLLPSSYISDSPVRPIPPR